MITKTRPQTPFRVFTEQEYIDGSRAGRALVTATQPFDRPRGTAALLAIAGCVLLALLARQALPEAGTPERAMSDHLRGRKELSGAHKTAVPISVRQPTPSSAREAIAARIRGRRSANRLEQPRSRSSVARHSFVGHEAAGPSRSPTLTGRVMAAPAPRVAALAAAPRAEVRTLPRDRRDFTFEQG